jgi:hypothetical protein
MVRMSLWLAAVVTLAALVSGGFAQKVTRVRPEERERNITGTYQGEGEKEDGSYNCQVEVIQKGDVYLVTWKFGDVIQQGIGIRDEDTLSVSWNGGESWGIAVFQITRAEHGFKLDGRWSRHPGTGKLYRETWTLAD